MPRKKKTVAFDPYMAGDVLCDLCEEFPGLVDGETEVDGGDLVAWLTEEIAQAKLEV